MFAIKTLKNDDMLKYKNPTPKQAHFLDAVTGAKNEVIGRWRFRTGRGSSLVGLKATKKWCKGPDRKYHWYVRIGGRWELDRERETA